MRKPKKNGKVEVIPPPRKISPPRPPPPPVMRMPEPHFLVGKYLLIFHWHLSQIESNMHLSQTWKGTKQAPRPIPIAHNAPLSPTSMSPVFAIPRCIALSISISSNSHHLLCIACFSNVSPIYPVIYWLSVFHALVKFPPHPPRRHSFVFYAALSVLLRVYGYHPPCIFHSAHVSYIDTAPWATYSPPHVFNHTIILYGLGYTYTHPEIYSRMRPLRS